MVLPAALQIRHQRAHTGAPVPSKHQKPHRIQAPPTPPRSQGRMANIAGYSPPHCTQIASQQSSISDGSHLSTCCTSETSGRTSSLSSADGAVIGCASSTNSGRGAVGNAPRTGGGRNWDGGQQQSQKAQQQSQHQEDQEQRRLRLPTDLQLNVAGFPDLAYLAKVTHCSWPHSPLGC